MSRNVKIILYAGLILTAAVFFYCYLNESQAVDAHAAGATRSRMMSYAAAFFGTLVAVALVVGYQVSHYIGEKTQTLVFNDDGEGIHDPEYDEAEKLWANGQHLDAIAHLREFLKSDPRQIHAALRIAEIYEKDLHNPLAAALEYEEILTKKLPPERWGWSAIHLVNLYSGPLNKPDRAMAFLQRIAKEYPQTGAARKARERLGLPEPELAAPAAQAVQAAPQPEPESEEEAAVPEAPQPEPPKSNLPPGFRPK